MNTSYNGWPASPAPGNIGIAPFTAAGVPFPGGVRSGPVALVLRYVAEQFHQRVEKLDPDLGCWGYAYRRNRNADNLSCHASGTALDCNAERHPNGKAGTFTPAQVDEIHRILAEVGHVVRWGGDFTGTKDEMHFELVGALPEVTAVARRLIQPAPTQEEYVATLDPDDKRELLEAITGGVRPADHHDKDPRYISNADLLTAIEKLPAQIAAALKAGQ